MVIVRHVGVNTGVLPHMKGKPLLRALMSCGMCIVKLAARLLPDLAACRLDSSSFPVPDCTPEDCWEARK